jgi:hypothetical protein
VTGHYTQWAHAYMQQCKQALHHIIWLSGGGTMRRCC